MQVQVQATTNMMEEESPMSSNKIDIESLRIQVSIVVAHVKSKVSLETLKPLSEFLGLTSTAAAGVQLSHRAYNPPLAGSSTMILMQSRIKDNGDYFTSNYVLVAAMVALVVALMHPTMLIFVGFVTMLWWCHGYLIKHELIVVGIPVHALLTVQQRFYFLLAISFVVVVWWCLLPATVFVAISSLIIFTHAALRDTMHLHEASQRGRAKNHDEEDPLVPTSLSK